MEKASAPLYLVITLLAFLFLIPSNAVPLSTVQRLPLREAGEMPSVEGSTPKPKMEMERFVQEDDVMINGRMVLEMQDYGPPGPNNHHTPPGRS